MRAALAAVVAIALIAGWVGSPRVAPAASSPRARHAHSVSPGAFRQSSSALAALLDQSVPVNNLWTLTARLVRHTARPIPRVVNHAPPDYPVGRVDSFWVLNFNTDIYARVKARLICKTAHLYLYVQDSVPVSRGPACRSSSFFERKIYPTDRAVFGSEWRPGIDDDPHITLFYGHTAGVGGYFSNEDEYPTSVNRFSNQREMMFIDSDDYPIGTSGFDSTAAHEFQHMVHWHMHPQDEAWDNEGASMLAQVINGFTADGLDDAYAGSPVQLDSWSDGDNSPNYGAGYLWWNYLYERFGRGFIHAMMAESRYSGLALARRELAAIPHLSLSSVFGDWVVANLLNNRQISPSYGYQNSQIHILPSLTIHQGSGYTVGVHPYQPLYIKVVPAAQSTTIHFRGQPAIPVIGAGASAPFWYSNRCDFCDTSMTRSVDLRSAANPVLRFDTWYDIEKGYDYGYVEASTDSGKTWQSVNTTVSTRTNPNGGNMGYGITGSSSPHSRGGWLPASASLKAYAGRRIELRFEYVTDDEFNGQSWAVKNISIDGADFHDRVGSTAWRLKGFLPVARNALGLHWSLRVITYGSGQPVVRSVQVGGSGEVDITVPSARKRRKVVLAIFGQAPKTTLLGNASVGLS